MSETGPFKAPLVNDRHQVSSRSIGLSPVSESATQDFSPGRRRSSIGFCPGRRDLGLTISHGARLRHPGDRPGRQQMADMRSSMAGPSCRLGRCSPSGRACAPLPGQRAVRRAQALLEPLDLLLHLQDHAPHLGDAMRSVAEHAPLAYERVVLPCSTMNCGDIFHRSTLDPALRGEFRQVDPIVFVGLGLTLAYLTATPGVLQGAWDTYVLAARQRRSQVPLTLQDFRMGRKIATGGFGEVYRATLVDPTTGSEKDVILKKAKDFGEAEVWMNERLSRSKPGAVAEFIQAFDEGDDVLWLAWKYEGDFTLGELMNKPNFPYNLEPLLFRRELNVPKSPRRQQVVLQTVMGQLLENLRDLHSQGIVHRDIKPQNIIISVDAGRVKLIDLGAAADLRVGINYQPDVFLLDPRFCPPQQYMMSQTTPPAPPAPVAAFLSPVLWVVNSPDRFDSFSTGMVLLQMVFAPLRNDDAIVDFKEKLSKQYGWNLRRWRASLDGKPGAFREGFEILDLDNGAGWNLLCKLMEYEPSKRPSADAALKYRFVTGKAPLVDLEQLVEPLIDEKFLDGIARTGEYSVLTEAKLDELEMKREKMPEDYVRISQTLTWWADRQKSMQRRLEERKRLQERRLAAKARAAKEAKGARRPVERPLPKKGHNGAVEREKVNVGARAGVEVGDKVTFKLPWQ